MLPSSSPIKLQVCDMPSNVSSPRGKLTQAQILEKAEELLVTEGFHAMSMRKVADACGISTGNLTYHFASKNELIGAIISSVFEEYGASRDPYTPTDQAASNHMNLREQISWLMLDSSQKVTIALFTELWALAKHSEKSHKSLQRFYKVTLKTLERRLARDYPEADDERLRSAARLIQTISEGTVAVSEFRVDRGRKHLRKDIEIFSEAVDHILSTGSGES